MNNTKYTYYAFISYKRSDTTGNKDEKWAKYIYKYLRNYKTPVALDSSERINKEKYIRPVFRDKDTLPGGGELDVKIKEALSLSKYLIVICSCRGAKSESINKEVGYFMSVHHDIKKLIPIIIDDVEEPEKKCFVSNLPSSVFALNVKDYENINYSKWKYLLFKVNIFIQRRKICLAIICGMFKLPSLDKLWDRDFLRIIVKIIIIGLLILVVAIIFGVQQCTHLREMEAERQQVLDNQSIYLAGFSEREQAAGNKQLAALLALHSSVDTNRVMPEAYKALYNPLLDDVQLPFVKIKERALFVNNYLVICDGTDFNVVNPVTFEQIWKVTSSDVISGIHAEKEGKYLGVSYITRFVLYDLEKKTVLWQLPYTLPPTGDIMSDARYHLCLNASETLIAIPRDSMLSIWDIPKKKELVTIPFELGNFTYLLKFINEDKNLLCVNGLHIVCWDTTTGEQIFWEKSKNAIDQVLVTPSSLLSMHSHPQYKGKYIVRKKLADLSKTDTIGSFSVSLANFDYAASTDRLWIGQDSVLFSYDLHRDIYTDSCHLQRPICKISLTDTADSILVYTRDTLFLLYDLRKKETVCSIKDPSLRMGIYSFGNMKLVADKFYYYSENETSEGRCFQLPSSSSLLRNAIERREIKYMDVSTNGKFIFFAG